MKYRQMLVDESKWNIKCPYEMKPEYITVHNTANDASAENEVKYMVSNDNEVSFRFSLNNLSKDGKIINIPLYFIEYINELNID